MRLHLRLRKLDYLRVMTDAKKLIRKYIISGEQGLWGMENYASIPLYVSVVLHSVRDKGEVFNVNLSILVNICDYSFIPVGIALFCAEEISDLGQVSYVYC
mgnify:CR=1 FL=1